MSKLREALINPRDVSASGFHPFALGTAWAGADTRELQAVDAVDVERHMSSGKNRYLDWEDQPRGR